MRRLSPIVFLIVSLGLGAGAQARAAGGVNLRKSTAKKLPLVKSVNVPVVESVNLPPTKYYPRPPIADALALQKLKDEKLLESPAAKLIEARDKVCYLPTTLLKKLNDQPKLENNHAKPLVTPFDSMREGRVAGVVTAAGAKANLSWLGGVQAMYTGVTDQNGAHHALNVSLRLGTLEIGPQYDSDSGWSLVRTGVAADLAVGGEIGVSSGAILRNKSTSATGKLIVDNQKLSGALGPFGGSIGEHGQTITTGLAVQLKVP